MELKSGVYGRYRLTVRRDDKVIEQTPWFDNLIVNNGLDLLGTQTFNNCVSYCYVGTDSTAPANTDTSLGAQIAATNTNGPGRTNTSNTTGSPYYFGYKYVKRFAKGAAAGNLTEVGMGRNAAGTNLFSRALILDGTGNPTTLTITSIDVLDVEYEFRVYVEEGDTSWSETVNGTSYSGVIKPAALGYINSMLAPTPPGAFPVVSDQSTFESVTGFPAPDNFEEIGAAVSTYVNGDYYREAVYSLTVSEGNYSSGISLFMTTGSSSTVGRHPEYQMSFNPAIPKDNTQTFEFTIRYTWARYTP